MGRANILPALAAWAVIAGVHIVSLAAGQSTFSITDMARQTEQTGSVPDEISAAVAASSVAVLPTLSAENCAENLLNSTAELFSAFAPCIASRSASEPCCQAVETTFTSEKFYGCLCHPVLLNTVISQANAFLPGASALIPDTLNNCTSEYGSPLAFYGQNNGSHTCDPSVIVDVDATLEVSAIDSAASALPLPTAMSRAEDDDDAADAQGAATSQGIEGDAASMDTALTLLSVLTVEQCGANLISNKDALFGAVAPCVMASEATEACCASVENIFKVDNEEFGGCLCHSEVVDGIYREAEGFMPGE